MRGREYNDLVILDSLLKTFIGIGPHVDASVYCFTCGKRYRNGQVELSIFYIIDAMD